jgi:hypothetical protein
MRQVLEQRLAQLEAELAKGHQQLIALQQTILRIEGAITICQELLTTDLLKESAQESAPEEEA